ncbi:MAG: SDR family oxidoreductase [Bacteroidales bacterium]|nr:SDR family oxidoreductase [Bacteroidales bacterium]
MTTIPFDLNFTARKLLHLISRKDVTGDDKRKNTVPDFLKQKDKKSDSINNGPKSKTLSLYENKSFVEQKPVAIITGATSGIGKEFAYRFASLGFNLIITGRRKNIISQTASEIIKNYKVNVKVVIADLSVKKDMDNLLKTIEAQKNIEVLVNNAGFGLYETFETHKIKNQLTMLKVHVAAPVILIDKVIPQMVINKKGIIINVTSLAAYTPTAHNAMYTSTKSFLTSYSESLAMQLQKYGIHVQCLCPGFTITDFHKKADYQKNLLPAGIVNWMSPSQVVDYSLEHLKNGKVICIPGAANRFLMHLISIVPRKMYYYLTNHYYRIGIHDKSKQYA